MPNYAFWGLLCLPPLRQQNAFGCAKDAKDVMQSRKARCRRQWCDAGAKNATWTRQPSSDEIWDGRQENEIGDRRHKTKEGRLETIDMRQEKETEDETGDRSRRLETGEGVRRWNETRDRKSRRQETMSFPPTNSWPASHIVFFPPKHQWQNDAFTQIIIWMLSSAKSTNGFVTFWRQQ